MVKIYRLLILATLIVSSAGAATIANMQYVGDGPTLGSYYFKVDGVVHLLFCNQFEPNIATVPYQANVATLADLTGSTLANQNAADALQRYTWVAILVQMAIADPSIAADAVWANRRIVDGVGPLNPGAQALYTFVTTQAIPGNYDLTGFKIFTNIHAQELGGYFEFPSTNETPEPAALVLIGSGLAAMGVWRRRRSQS